jgi:hypothetical protein
MDNYDYNYDNKGTFNLSFQYNIELSKIESYVRLTFLTQSVCTRIIFLGIPWFECGELDKDELFNW